MGLRETLRGMIFKGSRPVIRDDVSELLKLEKHRYIQYMYDEFFTNLMETGDLGDYFANLRRLLSVKDVDGDKGYLRVGKHNDGGYVMYNDFEDISCVYSFGISYDVSWDSYFAEKLGKKVYMYDHTIKALSRAHENFIWKKKGICGKGEKHNDLMSFEDILKADGNQDKKNILLKMDVERAEIDVFKDIDEALMNRFGQIVMEFHGLFDINRRDDIIAALENLSKTHQLVHVHANNGSVAIKYGDCNLPNLIELTYLNREMYQFKPSTRFFPTGLDERNLTRYPEIPLGFYN